MKRLFALSLMITASLASATPSEKDAKAVVQEKLIAPLKVKEERHSRFSRAYLPPQARRVRVLDQAARTDAKGGEFLTFAVDSKSGFGELDDDGEIKEGWRKAVITGCVYPESGEVFIKRGEKLFGAALLLGKKTSQAEEHVCVASGQQVATK